MKYILRVDILGNVPEIEISKSEYLALCSARSTLSNALAIEGKYEILISNYLDFEKEILTITANHMIRNQHGYSDSFNIQLGLNIRLVNLLTAARLYVDQLNQNAVLCLPDDQEVKSKIKDFFSIQYDNNISYRFMEALRNYVQHQGIPVHWTSHSWSLISPDADGLIEFSVEVCSVRSYFEKDKGLKKKVLDELEEKIDLKASTRSYIESISHVHHLVRDMISETTASSRSLIEDTRRQYAEIYGKEPVGLIAYKLDGQTKEAPISLLLDWDDVRVSLQKRNVKLTDLSKRYVTGAVKLNKKAK